MEAKLDDVAVLRDSVAAISELIDEAELRIAAEGISMVAPDRAVVVVVDFFLSKSAFSEYSCGEEMRVGVNLQNLLNVLRRASPGDSLAMRIESGKIHLTLTGSSTRKFTLPLIDVSKDEAPPLDKLDFSANVRASSEVISSGIDDAELVADSVVFTVRKDQLLMRAESDSSAAQLELAGGDGMKIIDIGEPVRARYSVDYLKKIFKARKLADEVALSMATDYPVRAVFESPGRFRISFVLAPRVED